MPKSSQNKYELPTFFYLKRGEGMSETSEAVLAEDYKKMERVFTLLKKMMEEEVEPSEEEVQVIKEMFEKYGEYIIEGMEAQ